MSQKPMSFRPRNKEQREDFALLCFVLEASGEAKDASKVLRLAVDDLIEKNRGRMSDIAPLYEAAQGALEQARQSLQEGE